MRLGNGPGQSWVRLVGWFVAKVAVALVVAKVKPQTKPLLRSDPPSLPISGTRRHDEGRGETAPQGGRRLERVGARGGGVGEGPSRVEHSSERLDGSPEIGKDWRAPQET